MLAWIHCGFQAIIDTITLLCLANVPLLHDSISISMNLLQILHNQACPLNNPQNMPNHSDFIIISTVTLAHSLHCFINGMGIY